MNTLFKWIIFLALSAFLPLIFAFPLVGTVFSPVTLMIVGSIGLLMPPNPLGLMVLAQILAYVLALYFLSKYLVRRFSQSKGVLLGLIALLLLLAGVIHAGMDSNTNLYSDYAEILN